MRSKLLLLLGVFTLLCVSTISLKGQGVTTSAMSGVVVDNEGEALEGATVIAVHVPTGSRYGAITRTGGQFNLPNLRVGGPYKVTAKFVGYADATQEGIVLQLGQTRRVTLTVAAEGFELDEVEITATTGALASTRTGAETVISVEQINSSPTVARAIGDFVRFTPQARITEGGDGFSISLNQQNNRFNAIYIDGAINNDVFGLAGSGTNGGQTGVSPFSLDAIESFQVALAPFDVRVGGFVGGAINAITRSGSNNVEASVYHFFRNEALAGKTPLPEGSSAERTRLADFTAQTSGFRVGGAIIKDKLFFFVNGEIERNETPQPFDFSTYGGDAGRAELDALENKLINQFGYNPGGFENNTAFLDSDKLTAKIDWNINENHKLSIRHSYVKAENLEAVRSGVRSIRYINESEFFASETNTTALEWNATFGSGFSNNLKIGYTSVRDDRDPSGSPFPYVRIQDGSGRITFGSERFSTANQLDQDIVTLTNNFTMYKGRHNITIGTHNEFFDVYNLFIRENFGVYDYDNLDQFLNDEFATEFTRSYSLVDNITGDGSQAAAEFAGMQLGFYVQDEWNIADNLTLTGGIRLDIPVYFDDTRRNDDFNDNTIPLIEAAGYSVEGASTGSFISGQLLVSPRVGFNWDVNGDFSTVIRGGAGIFTSRIPLVWPGGAFNNNGLTVGGDNFEGQDVIDNNIVFQPDVNRQFQAVQPGEGQPAGQIDLFAEDFKAPQLFKANVAVDQRLPWGMIGNVDVLFTKTINNVFYQNLNVRPSTENLTGTGDDRPYFNRFDRVDPTYSRDIFLATNTSKGYSYTFTAQLTKPFDNGFTAFAAYSYGDAFTLYDGTSSQNSSQWNFYHAPQGRNDEADPMRSSFAQGHRIISSLSYAFELGGNARTKNRTTFSVFYEGQSGNPYSFTYNDRGGLTNQSFGEYNLIYIPRDANDINLVEANGRSVEQQWAELDAFIEGDDYLSDNRGSIAERNRHRLKWSHVLDLRVMRDFIVMGGGKEHNFQLTLDIFNFTNLLNKNWGRRYTTANFGNTELLNFEGFIDGTRTPQFSFPGVPDDLDTQNLDDSGIQSSRWQMQVGIRYTFR